jgi:RNA-directed DNA polymerase
VTGLVVNRGINTSKEYRRRVRAMTHRLCKTGSFHVGRSGAAATPRRGNARSLHGMLGFVHSINQEQGTRSHLKPAEVPGERTYRRFLMFKYFYAADSPVVVCEGKTDTVYLAHAFRSLATTYPKLAERRADGEIILKIRRFRYTRTSTC